jgi:ribosome-binding factor A
MKRKRSFHKDLLASCAHVGPDDGLDPRTSFRTGTARPTNRKALQLCREVMRTVSYALAWELGDDLLNSLVVEAVVPAPNSSRLLVTVYQWPSARAALPEEVLARLHQYAGRLRTAVAADVHRRRVPELTFRLNMGKAAEW